MKVSLVTVCLNSESTIGDTIRSVLAQNYKDLEYIIFDGGSTDKTLSIIESYSDKLTLVKGTDSGIFDAMNQALSYTSGDVIGILNSDDFYANSQVLTKVVNTMLHSASDSVYGDLFYVYRKNTSRVYRNWKSGKFIHSNFKFGWTIPHPTFFVKSEVYAQYGGFDQRFRISGDYELILRFLYKHKISTSYIPEVLVKMRTGGNSDGGMLKRIQSLKEDRLAWKVNQLTPAFYTIPLKPFRKLKQLLT